MYSFSCSLANWFSSSGASWPADVVVVVVDEIELTKVSAVDCSSTVKKSSVVVVVVVVLGIVLEEELSAVPLITLFSTCFELR